MNTKRKAKIVVTGKCWQYGSKVYYDPEFGTYLQFVVKVPQLKSVGITRLESRIYVHWFKGTWEPVGGQWLECTGLFGGASIQEIIDQPPRANLILMCWGKEIKALE